MRAIYCLLALSLFGWASSEHAFKMGKTYTYQVRGRLMNGLTEMSTQYAGIEMDYKVILTVTGPNTVNFKPMDMKFFEVNDEIQGGWRDGELRNERPVELNGEVREYLESPMDVTFLKGIVQEIKVQNNLPNWVINMKKAQASHFVLDTTGVNLSMKGNLNRKTGHELPREQNMEAGFYYHTLEKTIHGECETYYTVSQNGPFNEPMPFHQQHQPGVETNENEIIIDRINTNAEIVGEHPWHTTFHNFCHEKDQVFEIVKSVNFSTCINKPVFSYMTPAMSMDARSGDNHFAGSMGLRAVISRVLACGKSREEFTVLKIRQEELVKVGLHPIKKIMTGAIKNLTLIDVTDAVAPAHIMNPKVINTLLYRFVDQKQEMIEMPQMDAPFMMNFGESREYLNKPAVEDEPKFLPKPTLTEAPVNPMLITPLKIQDMKRRVVLLIQEIVRDTLKMNHETETIVEKEMLSKISTVSEILRYMPYVNIEEIYHQIAIRKQTEEDQTVRQVFFDAIAMAGTNPNIKFILDLIQKREIVGDHVSRILMTVPMYIRTPTVDLLKEYFNLVQSEVLRGNKEGMTTAILSFSTVLYEACVNTHIRSSRYPVALYGKFCDAQVVEETFLPYFVKRLDAIIKTEDQIENTHWKLVYLTAIGNIGHPVVLPILEKYMDNVQNTVVRTRVILALKHMLVARFSENKNEIHHTVVDRDEQDILTDKIVRNNVMPILMSAAFDKGEHPDVRMAAITYLFHCSAADKVVFQQIAYMTWFPVSRQVHSLIYHSLKEMSQIERPVHPVHERLQTYAREVLSLCKPIMMGYQSSRNFFSGDYIKELLTGYFSHFEYFGSKDSFLPNMMYYRSFYQFGGEQGLSSNPMEFMIYGNTLQKLWNHLTAQFFEPSVADKEGHVDLNKINELLNIKDRKQKEAVEGYFYLKIQNEMERFLTVNKEVIEQWTKNIMGDLLPKLHQGLPINFQKTLSLNEYSMEIPTIFGLPLSYTHLMPVHFNLKGNLKLATEENMKDFQIQAELHPVYAMKLHDKLSIKVPFLNKKYETGFQKRFVAQFPFRALVRKAPRNEITVAITPTQIQEQIPNSELNLITVDARPYTAIITDECWPVFYTEAGRVKLVRVLETPYKNEEHFGEKSFGLQFHVQEESDYTVEVEDQSQRMPFWTQFQTPAAWFNFGFLQAPSMKYEKRVLTLNMPQSQTKTFAVVLGGQWWWTLENFNMNIPTEIRQEPIREDAMENDERMRVVAFIGKKYPIRPLTSTSGIQKILIKGTPSTFHYLAHFDYNNAIQGQMGFRLVSGRACIDVVAEFPERVPSLMAIKDYMFKSQIEGQQYDGCYQVKSQWEIPTWANPRELVVLRKRLLSQELVLNTNTEILFGNTCDQMPQHIQITGQWKRGPKMTEWARTMSPEAKKCLQDERKGFEMSPVCLFVSEHQAAAVNVADMEIKYTENIPIWFKNFTYTVEDFLKYTFYTYMQHNRFPESNLLSDQQMKFHFEMTPNKEFVTFRIEKPTGHIEFRNVETNNWVKKVLPFTATQTPLENFQDRTFGFYTEQSCALEGKWISTFDNTTFDFGEKVAPGCTHLLTKDCTGKYPMAVLVKDIHTERKTVTVLLGGKTKIIVKPLTSFLGLRQRNFQVLVNDEVVVQFPKVIRHPVSKELIATVEVMVHGGIQIISHRVKVATDGSRVVVYGHNDYRNRLCGICGNADFEKNADMRSPKNCPLSNGALFVASYAFDSLNADDRNAQCQIQPEVKARIEKEDADCVNQITLESKNVFSFNGLASSEEYVKFNAESFDENCIVRQRIVKRFPGVGICYSDNAIPQCTIGCYARNTEEKEVMFKCYNKAQPTHFSQYIMKQMTIDVPTLCTRY